MMAININPKDVNESPLLDVVYKPLTVEKSQDDTSSGEKQRDSIFLYVSAFSATLLLFGVGSMVVWTSPAISRLKSNNTDVNPLGYPVTTFQISLIAGLTFVGAIVGPVVLTKLCDIIGRRKALMVLSAIFSTAFIVLAFAKHLYLYYLCRFILGFGLGAGVSLVSIFLSEISEDSNRGKIGCLMALVFPMGNLFSYIMGPIFSIKIFTLLCAIPGIVNLASLMLFIPESPVYLASKGDRAGAIRSLEKMRNKTPSGIEKEYEKIACMLKDTSDTKETGWKTLFTTRSLRKGLIIGIGTSAIQHFSGITAILGFTEPLFDTVGAGISGSMTGILIGTIKITSVFIVTNIIEKVGKRPLLLISCLGCFMSLFTMGLFFFLKSINSPYTKSITWVPVIAVLLYCIFYSVGIGTIPMALMSELFPNNLKSAAVTIVTFLSFSFAFVVSTSFPILNHYLGPSWSLWGFSAACLIGSIFVYVMVPELKGKSFVEVQEILNDQKVEEKSDVSDDENDGDLNDNYSSDGLDEEDSRQSF